MPRVAIATTDGKVINEHFGRAKAFYIVDLSENGYSYVETRVISPCCKSGEHSESDFDKVISDRLFDKNTAPQI